MRRTERTAVGTELEPTRRVLCRTTTKLKLLNVQALQHWPTCILLTSTDKPERIREDIQDSGRAQADADIWGANNVSVVEVRAGRLTGVKGLSAPCHRDGTSGSPVNSVRSAA